nr:glycerophosphodiester phosphodiesterase family protein [Candidatus Sigynarchaeum springense]
MYQQKRASGRPMTVIAHRGYSSRYPENTLLAFEKAMEIGADYIEFDVRLSNDGILVVSHDASLERCGNANVRTDRSTLNELRAIDLGNGQVIPTLEEVFRLCKGKIGMHLEIKEFGITKQIGRMMRELGVEGEVDQRLEIIHFVPRVMKQLGIPVPADPPEFVLRYKDIAVSRLPLWLQRMYNVLEADGARLEFSCEFKELIFENGRIVGARVEKDGARREILARLVIDASGIACAVRSTLPKEYGVDTWKYDPTRMFYVILHYIKWKEPDKPHPKVGDIIPSYFQFFDPGYGGDECIMGIAVPDSFENAEKMMAEIIERYHYPPFELKKREFNYFPLSPPPYSLVGDGFFCAGDSASIINPLAARGIVETWTLLKNVEPEFDNALKSGEYLSKEILWNVNVKHFRNEGADLAHTLMIASFVHFISEKEINLLFEQLRPIVDTSPRSDDDSAPEEFALSFGMLVKILFKVIGWLLRRKVSLKSIKHVLRINGLAGRIKKHYQQYPEKPGDFEGWARKADEIWANRRLPAPPRR